MKRHLCLLLVLLTPATLLTAADTIGENFEAGGFAVGGSAYFYTNLFGYFAAGMSPYLEVFPADGLATGIGLDVDVDADLAGDGFGDLDVGIDTWLQFVLGYRAGAPRGPASAIGLTLSLDIVTDLNLGTTMTGGVLWPHYTFYYFIVPRVAPYVRLRGFRLLFGDYAWEAVAADLYLDLTIGISFHQPNKEIAFGRPAK